MAKKAAYHIKRSHEGTPVDIVIPEFGTRASGEPFIRLGKKHVVGHDCVVLTSGPGTPQMLLQLWLALGYLAGRRAGRIGVITGYLPLARSDKDEGQLEFALARQIVHLTLAAGDNEIVKVDRIIAVDLHAPQMVMAAPQGRITEVSVARPVLTQAMREARKFARRQRLVILFPDDGAYKKYTETVIHACAKLKIKVPPIVWGQKRRHDSRTTALLGLSGDVEALENAIVVSLDDEIATGSSNIKTAQMAKDRYKARTFWSVAVHGVICGDAVRHFSDPSCPIDRIYITDTIPPYNRPELDPIRDKLRVVSWVKDLSHIIYFHHWDDPSLREMR